MVIKFSRINDAVKYKDNKYLDINKLKTNEIEIDMDMDKDISENYTISYVIASIISNDSKFMDYIDIETLNKRNINEIDKIVKFLKRSKSGLIVFDTVRKDLLQFEIVTDELNYQVEIHLVICNFCICEDFDIIAMGELK